MQWNNVQSGVPAEKGSYIVTIIQQQTYGQLSFNYVAYYDAKTNTWYKQDKNINHWCGAKKTAVKKGC